MGRAEGEAESVLAAFFSSDYSFKQFLVVFVVVIFVAQSLSRFQLFMTQWTAALQASLPFTISWSLIKLMFIELMMPSNYLIFCCLLLLLPWIFPSVRVLSNESTLSIMWSKYSSFSFSISPSSEYSRLISFRIDWFNLSAAQGTLKSLLQHHSSKASVLWWSAYSPNLTFMDDYWKNHSFTRWTFVCKVMSLLFNMLSRLVITFLPRSKRLLILWLQSPSAVILKPPKIKSVTVSIVSPPIYV